MGRKATSRWGWVVALGLAATVGVPEASATPLTRALLARAETDGIPLPNTVLLVGSSSIEWGFGPALEKHLAAMGVGALINEGVMSTGLSRPDFFDWEATLIDLLNTHHPDLVIAQFGGNDAQLLRDRRRRIVAKWGEPGWRPRYAERVRKLVQACTDRGVRILFIGMPNMEEPGFAERMRVINGIVAEEATKGGAHMVSTWDLTSNDDGTPRLRVDVNGRSRLMRRDDGIHLGKHGAPWVAARVADRIGALFDLSAICDPYGSPPAERLARCEEDAVVVSCPELAEACTSDVEAP